MSQPMRLPQWPPQASTPRDLRSESRGGESSSIDQILPNQRKFEKAATFGGAVGRQHQPRLTNHPPPGESVLDLPIFGGDCWDTSVEAEDGQDGWETCSSEEHCLIPTATSAAAAAAVASAPPPCLAAQAAAAAAAADRGADSSSREMRRMPSIRPVLSSGAGSGNTDNAMRVRFAPEVEALSEASTSPPPMGEVAAGWDEEGEGEEKEEEEEEESEAAGRERQEEEVYVSADGQCFVRTRNGMHTAWRRRAMNTNGVTSSVDDRTSPPQQPPRSVVSVSASRFDGTALSPAVRTNSRSTGFAPAPASGRRRAASADRLITLSTPSTLQQPQRLFLRRSRINRDASSSRPPTEAGAEEGACHDAGPVLRARGANSGVGGAGVRRARDASGVQQAFPRTWGRRHSGMGGNSGVVVRQHLGEGDGMGVRRWGDGLLEALAAPPPHSCSGWRNLASTPAASKQQLAQQHLQPHHERHNDGGGGGGSSRFARSPLRRPTGASQRSPGYVRTRENVDENALPPPPGRLPPATALLSSSAVRQNLARVARRSKVGTTADPVTLYRQRQELEKARVKRAAARSRQKAIREERPWGGAARGAGRAPGEGVGLTTAGRGGRTRGGSAVLGRVGMSLR